MKRKMSDGLRTLLGKAPHDAIAAYNAALLLDAEHKGQAAVQYYCQLSAKMEYSPAMLWIAKMYYTGVYLNRANDQSYIPVRNVDRCIHWLKRAVAKNNDEARYLLARMYWDGIGMPQNKSAANALLSQITFAPLFGNPYESSEIQFFGSISYSFGAGSLRFSDNRRLTPAV